LTLVELSLKELAISCKKHGKYIAYLDTKAKMAVRVICPMAGSAKLAQEDILNTQLQPHVLI